MGNGGAERVIATLSNRFVKYGIDVSIITIYGDQKDYEINEKVNYLPIICKCRLRIFRPIERFIKIRNCVRKINPDVVVSFLADVNIHVILSLIGMDKLLIVSERNDPQQDPTQKWMRHLRDILYKRVNGIVFQTDEAKNYFEKILPRNIETAIIANPIKENLPYYEADYNTTEFLTACRLNPQKNLKLMIDAVNEVIREGYDCSLKIYGEGPLHEDLENYINHCNLGSYIELCGFTKEIHEKMAHAAGFIISSDYEGISNSMIEALAIGMPVIATDCPVGGARMYIKNGINGFLVPCNDKEALAGAIRSVLDDKKQAIMLGHSASSIRNELDPATIVEQWLNYMNRVCNRKINQ